VTRWPGSVPVIDEPVRAHAAPVEQIVARWRAAGESFVVLDVSGRHVDALAPGRIDVARSRPLEPVEIDAALHRTGYAVLDASHVARAARPAVLRDVLNAVEGLRIGLGRPRWVLVDDADQVLRAVDRPPRWLPLGEGGYCVAARNGHALPDWAVDAVPRSVRVTRPEVDLVLLPPAPADTPRGAHPLRDGG
jgi:hypothetical protein